MAEALAVLVVPQLFDLSKAALLFAWEQYDNLQSYKMQCKLLIERCQHLLVAVCEQLQLDHSSDSMRDNLHILESACISIRNLIKHITTKPFVWRLLHQDDISKALLVTEKKLQDAFSVFSMVAHVDAQRQQAELSAAMAVACSQDHAELVHHLEKLSRNDHKILKALEDNHLRLEELLVGLTKHLQNVMAPATSPAEKFIRHAVGALQRLSKEPVPYDIAPWQVTSLEVTFNSNDDETKMGQGSFGVVFKGEWQGEVVAVKEMYFEDAQGLNRNALRAVKKEIAIWSRLTHPRIVPFYGACLEATRPFMVSRFCTNGNILDYLRHHLNVNRFDFVLQVSYGMAYLHSQSVIHADLKGANILIGDDHKALICDFGVSHLKDQASYTTHSRTGLEKMKGTLRWMAPEILEGDRLDFPADVYTFGITVWELYTLEVPFSNIPERALFRRVIDKGERPQCPSSISQDLQRLVQQCWIHDAHKRPNFNTVSATLRRIEVANTAPGTTMEYKRKGKSTTPYLDIPTKNVPERKTTLDNRIKENNRDERRQAEPPIQQQQPYRPPNVPQNSAPAVITIQQPAQSVPDRVKAPVASKSHSQGDQVHNLGPSSAPPALASHYPKNSKYEINQWVEDVRSRHTFENPFDQPQKHSQSAQVVEPPQKHHQVHPPVTIAQPPMQPATIVIPPQPEMYPEMYPGMIPGGVGLNGLGAPWQDSGNHPIIIQQPPQPWPGYYIPQPSQPPVIITTPKHRSRTKTRQRQSPPAVYIRSPSPAVSESSSLSRNPPQPIAMPHAPYDISQHVEYFPSSASSSTSSGNVHHDSKNQDSLGGRIKKLFRRSG